MENYPPGITASDPHFNPPVCPRCEDEFDGEVCECGFEPDSKYDTPEGDDAYERMGDR